MKPDEVVQYGPMTLARYGRYVEQQINWDPDEFKKMRAALPRMRQRCSETIAEAVQALRDLTTKCDPLFFLSALFVRNCVVNPETYSEPEHEGSEASVEYAQSLVTAVTPWESRPPSREEREAFDENSAVLRPARRAGGVGRQAHA